ncbi:MAG: polyprenyl synthetase family protein [Vicinamibacteria bacterium]
MAEASVAGFAGLEAALQARRLAVDAALERLAPREPNAVGRAVADSLFAPSKRLRPVLTLLAAEVFRADPGSVLGAACSIEMVHTASLILDDLPSMDDAKLRRGRPACHLAHGEANAILAAFALINRAFELLAAGWPGAPDAGLRAQMSVELGRSIGLDGMIAGQALDLALTDQPADLGALEFIHSRKTGALFIASASIGALAGRPGESERAALAAYAKNLGLAFQIVDDIIDASGLAADSGKDAGQDAGKTTFVSFAGLAGARQLAAELVEASQQALAGFGPRADPLRELARYVLVRKR